MWNKLHFCILAYIFHLISSCRYSAGSARAHCTGLKIKKREALFLNRRHLTCHSKKAQQPFVASRFSMFWYFAYWLLTDALVKLGYKSLFLILQRQFKVLYSRGCISLRMKACRAMLKSRGQLSLNVLKVFLWPRVYTSSIGSRCNTAPEIQEHKFPTPPSVPTMAVSALPQTTLDNFWRNQECIYSMP